MMRSGVIIKSDLFFAASLLTILISVLLILLTGDNIYWLGLLGILIALQSKFSINISSLFPLIAILSLTEFYFQYSGKRLYLCELVAIPLALTYILTNFIWRPFNNTILIVLLLMLTIIVFQTINLVINSDFGSSFSRIRTLALPLILVALVDSAIKNKADLKRAVGLILAVSLIGTFIVYLQFFTGNFYVMQENAVMADDPNFIEWNLSATEDSFLFNLIGLQIKGPMPPVGLNYFKFGFSEKIIVPVSLFFAMFKFGKGKMRYVYLMLVFLLLFATLLTGSRSVLLTFLFVFLVIHLFYKKKLRWSFILFIIAVFFAAIYFIGPLLSIIKLEEFGTLAGRIFYMEDFFKFVANYPQVLIAGDKPESFIKLTGASQPPHHFFAFGIVSDGLIVTLILFYVFYRLLKRTRNFRTNDSETLAIGSGLWASLFGFAFIYGQTSYLTWSIPHNMFYYVIIGLLLAAYRINKNQINNTPVTSEINITTNE